MRPPSIAILEDDHAQASPFWESPFRAREYQEILRRFPEANIYATASNSLRTDKFQAFLNERAIFSGRVFPLFRDREDLFPKADLAYTVFLSNTLSFTPILERLQIPFLFELYPGGGFVVGDTYCDFLLARVFDSPSFRRVLVTQPNTHQYLLEGRFCNPSEIDYVFGGVFLEPNEENPSPRRQRFGYGKETVDICFVAHRYSPRGQDKGFDLFVEAADSLVETTPLARFHVVGGFDGSTIPLRPKLKSLITFYGTQQDSFFPNFYSKMDIIVSPNRPFVLAPGAFDGFPTGCCVEAALAGTTVICSDVLNLNRDYRDGKDIVLIRPETESLLFHLEKLIAEPRLCREVGENGAIASRRLFDPVNQIEPRLKAFSLELEKAQSGIRHHSRKTTRRRLFVPTELLPYLIRTMPDQKTMDRFGYDYELVQVEGDSILIACPAPGTAKQTEAKLDLIKVGAINRIDFRIESYLPFPGTQPFPMELTLDANSLSEDEPVYRRLLHVDSEFRSEKVSVQASPGRNLSNLRLTLRLAKDATHNVNAVVRMTQLLGLSGSVHSHESHF